MRKPEPYDETINYEELLTRYLKYLYKEWISVPRNARKYPPMVGKDIQCSFQNEITIWFRPLLHHLRYIRVRH